MGLLSHLRAICIVVLLGLATWPTHQAFLKTLSQACLCDVTDNCDSECCCDQECLAGLNSILGQYNKCADDGFGIPLCSNVNITDLHIADLYSGLRTIYTVIKRLFCVQRVNIIDPTSFYIKTSSDPLISTGITQVTQTSTPTLQPSNVSSLPQANINGIFATSEAGICVRTNSLPSNIGTIGMRECRALLATAAVTDTVLSVDSMVSVLANISIYSMGQSTLINPTKLTGLSSSCVGSTCSNIVRYVKLFINPTSNAVRQDLSYIVVGTLENVQFPSYIIVKYEYVYLNEDGTFAKVSNVGYKIGSPLQLLKKNQNTGYFKAHNPLNLAYRKPDGTCRISSTQNSDQSIIQLRLGRNEFHTCIGDQSIIYNNLKNSFDLIGVMGSSNTVLADYIAIDWPIMSPNPDPSNVLLKIYYVKVGSTFSPQYYVAKAVAEIISTAAKDKTLFIQYQEVDTTFSTYIPPPPKVNAYLPNDFLFPFYVAQ